MIYGSGQVVMHTYFKELQIVMHMTQEWGMGGLLKRTGVENIIGIEHHFNIAHNF
jgi:hypothetical protein